MNIVDNFAIFTPRSNDTRMTNMVQRDTSGAIVLDEVGNDMMNAFYNIHAYGTISDYVAPCNMDNSTDQIACLAVASPCSLGFAGMGANTAVPSAEAMKVSGIEATIPNIVSFDYPLTRYLWINSLVGFSSAESNQSDLGACYADQTKATAALTAAGFIEIPSGPQTPDPCVQE